MPLQLELQHGEIKFLIACNYCNGLIADPTDGVYRQEPLSFAHHHCIQTQQKTNWQPIELFLDELGKNLVAHFLDFHTLLQQSGSLPGGTP